MRASAFDRQHVFDRAAERARPLPVDDPELAQARRVRGGDPLGHELAHLPRREGVEVERPVERQRDRLAEGGGVVRRVGGRDRGHGLREG